MRRTRSPDRHLQKRPDGGYRYVRRVPSRALAALRTADPAYPETIRRSLDTDDLQEARGRRDAMERADDDHWTQAEAGTAQMPSVYDRAVARARTLKVAYRPAAELLRDFDVQEILARVKLFAGPLDSLTADAVLGTAGDKATSLDDAFATFETVIRKAALARKSEWQRLKWRQLKQRGLANFKDVVGDIAIEQIGRAEATKFYEWWLARIVPDDPAAKALSASAGNKDMDTMRALVGEHSAYCGRHVANPFAGLRFTDRMQRVRPAFSEAWLRTRILAPGALAAMNDDARRAVLAMINTGARPSEIVNLTPEQIVLDAQIPHIDIRETAGRELKTAPSTRRIPLVGVSLDALREARRAGGFARYRDKDTLSASVNKYFAENGLLETPAHTLYGLRHAFEQRLKIASVDEELRRYLMGHAIHRPKYGYSEELTWALSAVEAVAL